MIKWSEFRYVRQFPVTGGLRELGLPGYPSPLPLARPWGGALSGGDPGSGISPWPCPMPSHPGGHFFKFFFKKISLLYVSL